MAQVTPGTASGAQFNNQSSRTASVTVTAGSAILVVGAVYAASNVLTGCTGSVANPSAIFSIGTTNGTSWGAWVLHNAASGSHTFTVNAAGNTFGRMFAVELANADTSSCIDNTPTPASGGFTNSVTISGATASVQNCLAIAVMGGEGGASWSGYTNSYTELIDGALTVSQAAATLQIGASTTVPSCGATASGNSAISSFLIVVKPGASQLAPPRNGNLYRARRV